MRPEESSEPPEESLGATEESLPVFIGVSARRAIEMSTRRNPGATLAQQNDSKMGMSALLDNVW